MNVSFNLSQEYGAPKLTAVLCEMSDLETKCKIKGLEIAKEPHSIFYLHLLLFILLVGFFLFLPN